MGILTHCEMLPRFTYGLYARPSAASDVVNLYVDGELIRYKGLTDHNKTQRDAEAQVATTSFNYLKTRVDRLSAYFNIQKFTSVYVYMDGKRVSNKVVRTYPDEGLDVSTIRRVFKNLCESFGYKVVQLEYGESELQMYIRRDVLAKLNVFLTEDSDMLSILYGHRCTYYDARSESYVNFDRLNLVSVDEDRAMDPETLIDGRCDRIDDLNDTYEKNEAITVRDSCVWVRADRANRPLTVLGFDESLRRLQVSKLVFSIFCAMSGTDFTQSLIPKSMVDGFFTLYSYKDLEFVRNYDLDVLGGHEVDQTNSEVRKLEVERVYRIVVAILLSGFRCNGMLKKATVSDANNREILDIVAVRERLYTIMRVYYVYIKTGVMLPVDMPKILNPQNFVRTIVFVCRYDGTGNCVEYSSKNFFTANKLHVWAKSTTLRQCINNTAKYMQDYRAERLVGGSSVTKMSVSKLKMLKARTVMNISTDLPRPASPTAQQNVNFNNLESNDLLTNTLDPVMENETQCTCAGENDIEGRRLQFQCECISARKRSRSPLSFAQQQQQQQQQPQPQQIPHPCTKQQMVNTFFPSNALADRWFIAQFF